MELSEWRLVGAGLVALIVCLSLRMRLSRRRVQQFLWDWLGVWLSIGTINQCVYEAGRAVEPLEEQLIEEINRAELVHGDETPWKEWSQTLWLWVFTSATVSLYVIGYRSREMVENVLDTLFAGWLMSDGYSVYRSYRQRLRCWAHLLLELL